MIKVLEVNIDDLHTGGVFSLVKNVIQHNEKDNIKIDIAAIENFQNKSNVLFLKRFGCDVFYVGSECNKWTKQIHVYRNIKKLVKNNKYEFVHIHADTANKLLVSGLAAKMAHSPNIIFHSHSSGIDGNHRIVKKLLHKVCRILLVFIGTKFVACSKCASTWMFPKLLINDVAIINNGVDLKKFRFSDDTRKEVRKKLSIGSEILIGHVGRFMYQKNHEYLIKIIRELTLKGYDAKLLLVGEGPRLEKIKAMASHFGVDGSVIFYGTSNNVNELMQAFDVLLLPSHFEGLPIVGVEAQATGLPVIFSEQITREAFLTDNVVYLPIGKNDIDKWVNAISIICSHSIHRESAYKIMIKKKYDIFDTVNSFLNLYCKKGSL